MADDPLDFSPLDPDVPGVESRFVTGVFARIALLPDPAPMRLTAMWGVWSFMRPAAIAAALAIVIGGALAVRRLSAERAGPLTVAESIGVPGDFQTLLASRVEPGR